MDPWFAKAVVWQGAIPYADWADGIRVAQPYQTLTEANILDVGVFKSYEETGTQLLKPEAHSRYSKT